MGAAAAASCAEAPQPVSTPAAAGSLRDEDFVAHPVPPVPAGGQAEVDDSQDMPMNAPDLPVEHDGELYMLRMGT